MLKTCEQEQDNHCIDQKSERTYSCISVVLTYQSLSTLMFTALPFSFLSWSELTLTEGKNRQVRRMTAAVGYPTLRLIRSRIGSLVLGDLKPGAYRELKREELSALQYS